MREPPRLLDRVRAARADAPLQPPHRCCSAPAVAACGARSTSCKGVRHEAPATGRYAATAAADSLTDTKRAVHRADRSGTSPAQPLAPQALAPPPREVPLRYAAQQMTTLLQPK